MKNSGTKESLQARPILTPDELAEYLGLGRITVYRMLKQGLVPCRRAGSRYVIPRAAVEEWLKTAPCQAQTPTKWVHAPRKQSNKGRRSR